VNPRQTTAGRSGCPGFLAADLAGTHPASSGAAPVGSADHQLPRLGAIPYHLEHGTDPGGAGVRALQEAQDYCVCMGFYPAAVEYGYRGLDLVDSLARPSDWWMLVVALGLALSVLSRTREALELYDQARLNSANPKVHMAAAYSTAMLYARHNEPAERDESKAKSWLNSAIATASLLGDRVERAFQSAFYRNGCHSSNRLPSGSTAQPNRPNWVSPISSITSAPPTRSCASIASRSSTR